MLVHLFRATSFPSLCTTQNITVEDKKDKFDNTVSQTVLDNFYVDDCLELVTTAEEARKLIPQLCELLRSGRFRLTKWVRNNKDILSMVDASERASSVVDLDLEHMLVERTLIGIMWDSYIMPTVGYADGHVQGIA